MAKKNKDELQVMQEQTAFTSELMKKFKSAGVGQEHRAELIKDLVALKAVLYTADGDTPAVLAEKRAGEKVLASLLDMFNDKAFVTQYNVGAGNKAHDSMHTAITKATDFVKIPGSITPKHIDKLDDATEGLAKFAKSSGTFLKDAAIFVAKAVVVATLVTAALLIVSNPPGACILVFCVAAAALALTARQMLRDSNYQAGYDKAVKSGTDQITPNESLYDRTMGKVFSPKEGLQHKGQMTAVKDTEKFTAAIKGAVDRHMEASPAPATPPVATT